MKEIEYIRLSNLIKVRDAREILRGILEGDGYGISLKERREISVKLLMLEERLSKKVTLDDLFEDKL